MSKNCFKAKRFIIPIFSAIALLLAASASADDVNVNTTDQTPAIERDDSFSVVVDGFDYEWDVLQLRERAYVALREFSCMADNSVVSWDEAKMSAHVSTDSLELDSKKGECYIEANGRALWCEDGVFTYDGKMYVPLRQIAEAFGYDVNYSEEDHATYLTRISAAIEPDEEFYNQDDLYWLSKIIHAESCGEPFLGKLAVGNVVLNRVNSDEFPSTIHDVVFDRQHGVQFTPVANGTIDLDPCYDSVVAAKICLENVSLSDDILYFLNEELSTSFWIVENCTYVMTIGSHDFYME